MTRWIDGVRGRSVAIPEDLTERRRLVDERFANASIDPGLVVRQVTEPVRGEWVTAGSEPVTGTVLYLHGGGYVTGHPAHFRRLTGWIARARGIDVFSVDYRLAPEHPFPAAVTDATQAYTWLLETGHSAETIALGGDSAGAGLAVATLLAIKEAFLPCPAGAFAISPWVDMTLSSTSMAREPSADPWVSRAEFQRLVTHYLGDTDPRTPLASPVFGDLRGLGPLHIEAGDADRLVDDARLLAATARDAGVSVTIDIAEGAVHCFPLHVPDAPESEAAIGRIAAFLHDLVQS